MKFETVQEKVCYGMGRQVANQFIDKLFEGFSAEAFIAGVADGFDNKDLAVPEKELNEAFNEIHKILTRQQEEIAKQVKKEGEEYLAQNAKKEGVVVTPSGLQYEILKEGSGDMPGPKDIVRVKYKGSFITGEVFDSTDSKPEGIEFPVNGVIAGWTEALQLMKIGSIFRLVIPAALAYGSSGAGSIPPESTLVFEVELLAIPMQSKGK